MQHPSYFVDSVPGRNHWPIAFAHRGADTTRENTLAAFSHAVETGFGYLELDVRTAADGTLVVFHDNSLDRVSTGTGKISEHTWDTLQHVHVGNPADPTQLTEPLVRFEDLLTALPETRFNVDLKDADSAAVISRILYRHNAWNRVLIASFQDTHRKDLLHRARRLTGSTSNIATSAGISAIGPLVFSGPLGLFRPVSKFVRTRTPFHAVQVPLRQGRIPVATQTFINRCHAAGIHVHIWVIDDPEQMEQVLDMGADGIMTDQAQTLADVFSARGQWPQR